VLVKRIIPPEHSVWFDGGTFATEEEFWQDICDRTESFTTVSQSEGTEFGADASAEAATGVPVFASLRAKLSTLFRTRQGTQRSRQVSDKSAAIRGIRSKKIPVVVDDFHYLDRESQKSILRALKPLVFDGIQVVLISIPHRKFDVLKSERELAGRVTQIEIPPWDLDELVQISDTGFPLLNVHFSTDSAKRLAAEAYGSPHLMQEFCVSICDRHDIDETREETVSIEYDSEVTDEIFVEVAEDTGRPVYDRLRRGPRSRKDRIVRTLVDGQKTDIYGVVLRALADIRPSVETIHIQKIRDAVRAATKSKPPSAHEVSRVLDHMSSISIDDSASAPVLDYEKDEALLHVTDPFFAFFLRWGELNFEPLDGSA
jgi:hypothetical protein